TMLPWPALTGNLVNTPNLPNTVPRVPLQELVSPLAVAVSPGQYLRPGAAIIMREQGQRFIAVKVSVRDRDLAGTVADAQQKVEGLLPVGYRTEWGGEFGEMQEAEARLSEFFAVSLVMIALLLYLAFRSVLDALVVFANVLAVCVGGIWALWLTGLNFNVSAG